MITEYGIPGKPYAHRPIRPNIAVGSVSKLLRTVRRNTIGIKVPGSPTKCAFLNECCREWRAGFEQRLRPLCVFVVVFCLCAACVTTGWGMAEERNGAKGLPSGYSIWVVLEHQSGCRRAQTTILRNLSSFLNIWNPRTPMIQDGCPSKSAFAGIPESAIPRKYALNHQWDAADVGVVGVTEGGHPEPSTTPVHFGPFALCGWRTRRPASDGGGSMG